ncbi:MAG: hypothetical protein EKK37_17405 [Sphingobacteriales bacterium]|nr:MAG: hypothetical protein EKK37_17405 [Sphingobacteriales bacterium]
MILLKLDRSHVQHVKQYFFPFIRLQADTRLNNLAHAQIMSDEWLTALTVNNITEEIMLQFEKKIINTTSRNITFKLSTAQAIVFYKTLLSLPLPAQQIYLNTLRNNIIEMLDLQLIKTNSYQATKNKALQMPGETNEEFYFDYE